MAALFACTKCHGRHPFEELSKQEQLCKNCLSSFPTVKCDYCRIEFQISDKSKSSSVCRKCLYNIKNYGKPRVCEYCTCVAAFIGNKCQRCANSEKKWGPPVACEQCKQKCAYDRNDESQKKLDGRILCWICTQATQKVMAKSRKRENGTPMPSSGGSSGQQPSAASSDNKTQSSEGSSSVKNTPKQTSQGTPKDSQSKSVVELLSQGSKSRDSESSQSDNNLTPGGSAKKPRLDKSSSNGLTKTSSMESVMDALAGTENMVALTQLREEVESMKKVLQQKEQQMLEKDKKLTELKAQNYEAEKDMRLKVQKIQKDHSEALENLQTRNRDLQKQISQLTKGSKKNVNSPSV